LKMACPDAEIDMLVGPQSGEVLSGCPYISNFITFDTTRFHKYDSGKEEKRSFWSYVGELRKKKYDLVFVLKRSFSSAFLALSTGARYRVGYATENRSLMLTHKVAWQKDIHEVESLLQVLRAAGVPVVDDYLEAWISQTEAESVRLKVPSLKGDGKKVLIHAAAAHKDKLYPLTSWAEIIRELNESKGMQPYFTGAAEDRATYQELETLSGIKAINMAGELSIRESMALYQKMDLAVCVDSGPAHLACAVGTPTVTLFGPTDPVRWAPYGKHARAVFDSSLDCRPCNYKKVCDDRPCLTQLEASKVTAICHELEK
ncbi:MAG: glycosyltransferase family 9 protein, partial [Candidatus Obscuribacterales bacterium]|nr:glycosyltransferase family 9 protein [Candidatus Obscuribacterales bacterium]